MNSTKIIGTHYGISEVAFVDNTRDTTSFTCVQTLIDTCQFDRCPILIPIMRSLFVIISLCTIILFERQSKTEWFFLISGKVTEFHNNLISEEGVSFKLH